ncbi:hypothetical protein D6783_01640 [Candidatus Woesearchaeota archaeon]|nr:MAG: hypothetical protein D6783_01640 [Candidatus Woesearchaeota archaeon]
MAEDISRRTILVLVLLTLLISVLGVMTVTYELGQIKAARQAQPGGVSPVARGEVALTIQKPPTGEVVLTIEKPSGE